MRSDSGRQIKARIHTRTHIVTNPVIRALPQKQMENKREMGLLLAVSHTCVVSYPLCNSLLVHFRLSIYNQMSQQRCNPPLSLSLSFFLLFHFFILLLSYKPSATERSVYNSRMEQEGDNIIRKKSQR